MTDRDAFLAGIRASPDDDTVRLVFADWLEDNGEPERAELIRLQCELEPVREKLDDSRVQALWQREEELLAEHFPRWAGEAADLGIREPQFGPVFVRGFPERICVSLDTLLSRGEQIFAACPTVRDVAVFDVGDPRNWGRQRGRLLDPIRRLDFADSLHSLGVQIHHLRVLFQDFEILRSDTTPRNAHSFVPGVSQTSSTRLEFLELHFEHQRFDPEHIFLSASPESYAQFRSIENRMSFLRPYEARFPLLGDVGHGLIAGQLPSGMACLAAITRDGKRVYLVTFNADGTFSKTLWEDLREGAWSVDRLRQRFGFTTGLIRIREFRDRGLAVRLWPQATIRDFLQHAWNQPGNIPAERWRVRGGILRKWLEQGRFVVEWQGQEHIADRRGRLISSVGRESGHRGL